MPLRHASRSDGHPLGDPIRSLSLLRERDGGVDLACFANLVISKTLSVWVGCDRGWFLLRTKKSIVGVARIRRSRLRLDPNGWRSAEFVCCVRVCDSLLILEPLVDYDEPGPKMTPDSARLDTITRRASFKFFF